MHRGFLALLIVVMLSGLAGGAGSAMPPAAGSAQPVVTALPDGIAMEWHFPELMAAATPEGTRLSMVGFELTHLPGRPEIPSKGYLIALPVDAQPELVIQSVDEVGQSLSIPVFTTAAETINGPLGQTIQVSTLPSDTPETPVAMLKDLGDLQGVRLAQLTVSPTRANGSVLLSARSLKVEIQFHSQAAASAPISADLSSRLASKVINPDTLAASPSRSSIQPQTVTAATGFQAAIEIGSEGLYKVTYDALAAAGLPAGTANPLHLHLTHAGAEVPLEFLGDADDLFETGEAIYFYGKPRQSRWTTKDVYYLADTGTASTYITARAASITSETEGAAWYTQLVEKNQEYIPDCLCASNSSIPMLRDGDRWAWVEIIKDPGRSGIQNFAFDLSNPNPAAPATLTLWVAGSSDSSPDPDHLVTVSLNGTVLSPAIPAWNGRLAVSGTFNVPTGLLAAASNSLTIKLEDIPGVVVQSMWVDAFQVRYQPGSAALSTPAIFDGEGGSGKYYTAKMANTTAIRIYDVTNPALPVRLTGERITVSDVQFADQAGLAAPRFLVLAESQALAPASLRAVQQLRTSSFSGLTWTAITPAAWIPALAPLVALRQSQGFTTAVEAVEAIYDQYGQGLPTPDAIKSYLQQVYAGRPTTGNQYVLLAGDGTIDPKHYDYWVQPDPSSNTFIPPYLADYDPWSTENAADNRYVTMGVPGDLLPDMVIGRMSANSAAEVTDMVNKIISYEAPKPGQTWMNKALFVAANPDSGGDYRDAAQREASLLSCTLPSTRFFHLQNYTSASDLRTALYNSWNNGAGLVVFHGHASIHAWDTQYPTYTFTDLFHFNDAATLTNGGKLPVSLSMTCFTGAFQTRTLSVLDEQLVRVPNGGSIAAWGSTGMGLISGQEDLAQGFLAWTITHPHARVGDAALAGKVQLLANNIFNSYLADSFTIFGDPATVLAFQDTQKCVYLPNTVRGGTP